MIEIIAITIITDDDNNYSNNNVKKFSTYFYTLKICC